MDAGDLGAVAERLQRDGWTLERLPEHVPGLALVAVKGEATIRYYSPQPRPAFHPDTLRASAERFARAGFPAVAAAFRDLADREAQARP